jgi:hypothetical protein
MRPVTALAEASDSLEALEAIAHVVGSTTVLLGLLAGDLVVAIAASTKGMVKWPGLGTAGQSSERREARGQLSFMRDLGLDLGRSEREWESGLGDHGTATYRKVHGLS